MNTVKAVLFWIWAAIKRVWFFVLYSAAATSALLLLGRLLVPDLVNGEPEAWITQYYPWFIAGGVLLSFPMHWFVRWYERNVPVWEERHLLQKQRKRDAAKRRHKTNR